MSGNGGITLCLFFHFKTINKMRTNHLVQYNHICVYKYMSITFKYLLSDSVNLTLTKNFHFK